MLRANSWKIVSELINRTDIDQSDAIGTDHDADLYDLRLRLMEHDGIGFNILFIARKYIKAKGALARMGDEIISDDPTAILGMVVIPVRPDVIGRAHP